MHSQACNTYSRGALDSIRCSSPSRVPTRTLDRRAPRPGASQSAKEESFRKKSRTTEKRHTVWISGRNNATHSRWILCRPAWTMRPFAHGASTEPKRLSCPVCKIKSFSQFFGLDLWRKFSKRNQYGSICSLECQNVLPTDALQQIIKDPHDRLATFSRSGFGAVGSMRLPHCISRKYPSSSNFSRLCSRKT